MLPFLFGRITVTNVFVRVRAVGLPPSRFPTEPTQGIQRSFDRIQGDIYGGRRPPWGI